MRKTVVHTFAAMALVSACTAGAGPIGVGAIGGREDPGSSLDPIANPQGSQGAGATSNSSGGSSGGSGSSGSSSLSCSGSRQCSATSGATITAQFSKAGQDCQVSIVGDQYTLASGGAVVDSAGKNYGTWRSSGSTVTICDTKNVCVSCVAGGGSTGSDSGASNPSPSDGGTNTSPTLEAGYQP
jgi:hypothetical protein